jgi:bifunctional DNA-binding transcriptional regulator/antitoxin component of YhaV-PrlF toxin-antitoxin module
MKAMVSIDAVGRMVLPKLVREAMGISGRGEVAIEVVGDRAELRCADNPGAEVSNQGRRLVHAGPLPEGWDSGAAVDRLRRERLGR